MKQIKLFKDILEYIGIDECNIELYLECVFSELSIEEIIKMDQFMIASIISKELENNINLYFDSGRNELIQNK